MSYTVTITLNDHSKKLFDEIPRGKRSKAIRDALLGIDVQREASLRAHIDALLLHMRFRSNRLYRDHALEWDADSMTYVHESLQAALLLELEKTEDGGELRRLEPYDEVDGSLQASDAAVD